VRNSEREREREAERASERDNGKHGAFTETRMEHRKKDPTHGDTARREGVLRTPRRVREGAAEEMRVGIVAQCYGRARNADEVKGVGRRRIGRMDEAEGQERKQERGKVAEESRAA
jgi:hypothetical protein